MRILDLDLDVFLSNVSHWDETGPSGRLEEERFRPWSEEEVRAFLEHQCGLSTSNPTPGKIVTWHHEVFLDWRNKVEAGVLAVPFDVVHVDAHADLGEGDTTFHYIQVEILNEAMEKRPYPRQSAGGGMDESNWLAFAITCGWIGKLTYVPNPRSENDVPCYMYEPANYPPSSLRLRRYPAGTPMFELACRESTPLEVVLSIPLEITPIVEYRAASGFDFIYLAQSPANRPASADPLIDVVRTFMELRT